MPQRYRDYGLLRDAVSHCDVVGAAVDQNVAGFGDEKLAFGRDRRLPPAILMLVPRG